MPKRSSRPRGSFPERRWHALTGAARAFAARRFDNPWFAPLAGAAMLAAILIGIRLGDAAVAEIDPLAFHEPVVRERPRAADDSNLPLPQRSYSAAYGWADGYGARDRDCGPDCAAYLDSGIGAMTRPPDYSARAPYFGSDGDLGAAIARARDTLGPSFPETHPDAGVPDGPILRYSHFPITADEQNGQAAAETNQE
jgi:hypothetical protein